MSKSVKLSDAAVEELKCAARQPETGQWVSGSALGQLSLCFQDLSCTVGDAAVTALAFHPKGRDLAVAHENELKIHDAKEWEKVLLHAAVRFTMPITHVHYSHSGQHM